MVWHKKDVVEINNHAFSVFSFSSFQSFGGGGGTGGGKYTGNSTGEGGCMINTLSCQNYFSSGYAGCTK